MKTVQKISPCLWFDHQAEEAARFYTGIFKNSRILKTTRYGKAGYEVPLSSSSTGSSSPP